MKQLSDRIALVTGGGRGIGRAIALGYAKEGASIAAVARSERELKSLEREIRALGSRAVTIPADLSDPHSCRQVVNETVGALGGIDILVNNAGVGSSQDPRPVVSFDDELWDYALALNLSAPYHLCKAVIPLLLEKKRGRIVNIASIASRTGLFHGVAYAASKHGLLGLTRTLAIELASEGITANAICPGPVRSETNEKRMRYDADRLGITVGELERRITPIGRRLNAVEIVPIAILLASDDAGAINGQAFNIDGGLVMS
jgi:3-oxoacyl-[acyl-carrier protein] reductase